MKRSMCGFTLIEIMLYLVFIGTVLAWSMAAQLREFADAEAKALGVQLAQFESAVTAFVFANRARTFAGTPEVGVSWLKSAADCSPTGVGTGSVGYLPCNFPATLRFGLTMNTTFTVTPPNTPPQNVVAKTEFRSGVAAGVLQFRGQASEVLAAKAIHHARTITNAGAGDVALSTFLSFARVSGVITGTVDLLAGGSAPFLYTDGRNTPIADIDWAGNRLFNASELSADRVFDALKDRSLAQAIQDVGIYENGALVDQPICQLPEKPEIFIAPFQYAAGLVGENIQGVFPEAVVESGPPVRWRVKLRLVTPNGDITPPDGYGRMTVFTKCT